MPTESSSVPLTPLGTTAEHQTLDRTTGDPPHIAPINFYNGLSERSKLWILAGGAAIACLNLLAAWNLSQHALTSLTLTLVDVQPFRALIDSPTFSIDQRHDLTSRAMHIVTISKMIANKQGVILACFSGAFALAAIGFSLFVIGADGAFKVSSAATNKAQIVLTGTAPGLLCFLVCGYLIQQGAAHRSEMVLPPFTTSLSYLVDKSPAQQPAVQEKKCIEEGATGKCTKYE